MEYDTFLKNNNQDPGTHYKTAKPMQNCGSSLTKCNHLSDVNMEDCNGAASVTQQSKQDGMSTNTDTVIKCGFRGLPLITERVRSDSSAGMSSSLENGEQKSEHNGPLPYPDRETDNNNNSSNDTIDGDDGGSTESHNFSDEDVIHKLHDAAVVDQFNVLANLKGINQSNLSMLERVNRSDPSVKRVLARARLTVKEVNEISIDADIETTVNEFLQTNMAGNFVMVRVMQENYCRFYSWLTTHLQVERNAWAARLKQALEKMEMHRRDCLGMKDVLEISTSRLQHLIQACTSVTIRSSGKSITDEKSSRSRTSFSTNTVVFPYGSSGCCQASHGQTTAASSKDEAYQQEQNTPMTILNKLDKGSRASNRSTNTSQDHSDLTYMVTNESNSVPHSCGIQDDSYTPIHNEVVAGQTSPSMNCCCTSHSPSRINSPSRLNSPSRINSPSKINIKKELESILEYTDGVKCENSGVNCANAGVKSENSGVNWANAGVKCENSGVNCANDGVKCENSGVNCANDGVKCENSGVNCANDGVKCENSGVNCANAGVKCVNDGQKLASSGKDETENDSNDDVDWTQAMTDSIDALDHLCGELLTDHIECRRMLGVCPIRCSSLMDALLMRTRDRCPSGCSKRREVEEKYESLEIENRQLVKQVNILYRSLMQKTNEVINLNRQIQRLEEELMKESTRVVVGSTSCLVFNSPEINRNKRNSYQINRHQRNTNQLNRRYNNYNSGLHSSTYGLSLVASKPKISGGNHEMSNHHATGVGNIMPRSNKIGLEDMVKSSETQCHGTDSSSTSSETLRWPSSDKIIKKISKQTKIKLGAIDGSTSSRVELAGTELIAKRESQRKSQHEIAASAASQASIKQRKLLQDTNTSHQRQRQYCQYPSHSCTSLNLISNYWRVEKIGHETCHSESDVGHSSRWHQLNKRSAVVNRHTSPTAIPNPCNSPENIETASVTNATSTSSNGQQLNSNNRVRRKKTNIQCTDTLVGRNDNHIDKGNCNSPDKTESATVSMPILNSCDEQQLSNSNGAITRNIFKCTDNHAGPNDDPNDTSNVLHSLISSQMKESIPVSSRPSQDSESELSKCLRCHKFFLWTDNHKQAYSYHKEDLTSVQQQSQDGKMVQVTNQLTCYGQTGDDMVCAYGRHI